jgi:hypothetical protein
MVKRIAPLGVVAFVWLGAWAAVCQDVRQSPPDAPSPQAATQLWKFSGLIEDAHSPFGFGAINSPAIRQGGFAAFDNAAFRQRKSNPAYSYSSLLNRQASDHPLSGASLIGRATYAASRPLLKRDGAGKARLNTSYLLRTLTSVARDTASTPYWRRSIGEPFSDFGSTVGNDAGMNLWREFGPNIEQLMKSHTPAFVSRVEARFLHR